MSGGAEDLDGNFKFDDANDTGSHHINDTCDDDDDDDDDGDDSDDGDDDNLCSLRNSE
jgi:hypothetical protein